jgi:D-inositol-3-phosphate glycosyltransferase
MDMVIRKVAFMSVHTSPLAPMGGKKTGGMNVYVRELASELGARGIQVDIFTRRSHFSEPEVDNSLGDNVRVIYLQAGDVIPMSPDDIYPHIQEFTAHLMAFNIRDNSQYDVVYSHYWLSGLVAAKLKEAWGIPFVQMFHTLGQMKQRIVQNPAYMSNQRIVSETEIIALADRIIAATPAEHAQLLWLYRARRQKVEIIPPGVNISRFQPTTRERACQQLDLNSETNLLLFVGRIEPLKAVDTIIEALYYLRQEQPDVAQKVQFAVIGGDPDDRCDLEMQRLKTLTLERGLQDAVTFLGARDQSVLPQYYAAATAVIMPSDYESFGMVALEAMASGTPVIASHVGGLAYLVRNEETGYLVPVREPSSLANCIRQLVTDPKKCQQMGVSASSHAQNYAWHHIADRLLALFDEISKKAVT